MARRQGSRSAAAETSQHKSWSRHDDKSMYQIQSVINALSILEQVADFAEGVTADRLRKDLGLTSDAALRLIATLERRGYLELDRLTNHYHLSLQTLNLSQTFIRQATLFHQARPIIEELSRECGETVYIAVFRDRQSVYLQQAETRHSVRVVSRFGSQLPAYCSAGGKVLLAGMTAEDLAEYLGHTEFVAYTPSTITDREALESHLRQVASQGFAINEEELESGVCGVAGPIRNHTRQVVAAAVISAPTIRVSQQRLHEELVPQVRAAADQISGRLGYNPVSREEG
jgi:DNA-binding IclR family transcriptional regulator